MRDAHRPMGRFFCLLLMTAAWFLAMTAGMRGAPPPGAFSLTQVSDVVYRADGQPAKGTVLISWPAFTTVEGYAVAAGVLSVPLHSGGAFSASLAPNTGAQPAGVYYKIVYQLDGQQPSTEYWVVPATGSVNIGSVRAKLMPPTIAAQVLTRDVADSAYVHVAGDSTVNGVITFTAAPTLPDPQKATDAANKQYVDSTSSSALASPAAIGSATPNAGTFTTVNKVINPLAYSGSDIGAQVTNAIAANSCGDGIVSCSVQLPPTRQLTFATTIALPQDTHLVCTPKAQNSQYATLNYNGSSYAVSLQGESSGIEGCDFNIGASATEGIHQAAPNTTVHSVSLNGGGTGTILHHITGANMTFDSDEKMWNLTGIGVQVDNSIDVFLKTFDVYGAISSGLTEQTSISLLVESGVGGLNVTDWSGGGSGLHGLVVRNTANPSAGVPSWLNFHNFVSDCSGGGDGWLFDSSLGSAQIGATFVDSWSAGAGQDCNQVAMTNASAVGVHISGGSGIHILGGGKIRANASHGVLIDGTGLQGIEVADNQITANGFATDFQTSRAYGLLNSYVRPSTNNVGNYLFKLTAAGTSGTTNPTWCQTLNCTVTAGSTHWQNIGPANEADGIYVASALKQLSVHDNKIATQPESQGIITWGVRVDSDSPGSNIHDNTVSDTLAGALKMPSGITLNLVAHDNNNTTSTQVVPQIALGPISWRLPAGPSQGPAVIPNTVGTGSYIMGFGNNLGWNGSSFTTTTDTASNGASLMGMNYNSGAFSFYVIPSNSPASGQSIGPGAMSGYIRGTIDSNGFNGALGKTMPSDAYVNDLTVNGTCNGCGMVGSGYGYLVSKYTSIQAAIDAAYNNGAVQGDATVIDDRLAPYSGPGFIVKDSVTLKLAATTYTITGTVSNNNGIANVTAGIISMPGSHIVGAGTSPNHGTNLNAGSGLNADLIATSTVGTGSGANAQWWHWGSIENFHIDGNKANQTAGNCINVENMGETAVLRALELGNCYSSDIKLEGNFATQSEISNVTVNSAGQFGVNLDNFEGVGVLRGLSGDSNATSIIRFNGNQSATLTVLGLKSEEEISGHDPLITIDMPTDGSQPAFSLVGGYTYARPGVHDVIKVINGKAGVAPFVTVSNFYVDANFVNAVNDAVNGRTFAAANMNKVPFSYLPTGSYQSGQAFTFAPGTFIQGGSSALTEIFGSSTDGSSMIASQGNGDGTSYYTGGLKIGIPNRTQFGQPPEMMARMGSRFLGAGQGYDANTWVFVPIWKTGDSSNRWIGDPNQRWPEVYASDVNATTATVGTLNVTSCVGCGAQHSLTLQGPTSAVSGTGSMAALYNVTIPAGTFSVGTGLRCTARSRHTTGTGSVSMGWRLGSTTYTYPTPYTTGTTGGDASIEIFTFSSLVAETVNIPWASFGGTTEAPYTGLAWSENVSGATTLQFMFSAASGDKLTGDGLYCTTVQ